jgi:hypothetical protein
MSFKERRKIHFIVIILAVVGIGAIRPGGNDRDVIMESPDYYQSLKQDCTANHDIFYEDFNQNFQAVDASQNQWSINGHTWWFPNHQGQAPQTRDSFLVLNSQKNESNSTYKKQEAQTIERFFLPDAGELVIGLWSDRWEKYPGLPANYWADSSVGLEFFIGSRHYAVVFIYGHLGVLYVPAGSCQHADAVCQYGEVVGWWTIAATADPIALRTAWTTTGNSKTFNLYITTRDSQDTEPRVTIANVNYIDSEALSIRLNANVTDTDKEPAIDSDTLKIDYVCLRGSTDETSPGISLNRQHIYFGVTMVSPNASPQALSINNSGSGTLNWAAVSSAGWLQVYPASGTGNGEVSVSADGTGLAPGTYTGTITVTDPKAGNSPQVAAVTLTVYQANASAPPFGEFSTPGDGATVRSSIPVTGWVLDDIGVESVKIYREDGRNLVYIGDAVFVEGARPDVEAAYPGYPMNYKAGWGYMMLTNFLPNGGNGVFKIHAIATDKEGQTTTLGIKTITVDNANAVKPFGAIDTPTQGGTASGGSFTNWGWALTPRPNRIPTDGSTINVWVDGINLGNPTYNIYRSDIAALFPGYANSNGSAGYFCLDTTAYENGVHTIQWTATDSAGNTDGIGSRYFTIENSGAGSQQSLVNGKRSLVISHWSLGNKRLSAIPVNYHEPVLIKKGYSQDFIPEEIYPDNNGIITVEIKELERVELRFEGTMGLAPLSTYSGFQVIGDQLKTLPAGSTLDTEKGIFYWQPGVGFYGIYEFVFIEKGRIDERKVSLRVNILPKR